MHSKILHMAEDSHSPITTSSCFCILKRVLSEQNLGLDPSGEADPLPPYQVWVAVRCHNLVLGSQLGWPDVLRQEGPGLSVLLKEFQHGCWGVQDSSSSNLGLKS